MTDKSMPRRLRVLMSAYACEPGKGSEPGIGWNLAKAMAKRHDVWVLTRANNRPAIEAELAERPVPNLDFLYYDLPRWARWWKRGGRGVQLYYYLWQFSAINTARKAHKKEKFDIAQHVTFKKYWAPSAAAFIGAPFVWGPVGGGESMPKSFFHDLSLKSRIYERFRSMVRRIGESDPFVLTTARRANVAIATTKETSERIQSMAKLSTVEGMIGDCMVPEEFVLGNSRKEPKKERTITFISSGRFLGWKGYHLSIRAFAELALENSRYILLGDGPEKNHLQKLAKELSIEKQIEFIGSISRGEVIKRLSSADIFVHPSLHDSGGWATLEAMASGLPVICLDIGGPAVQVNSSVGRKIPAINPSQTIKDLTESMRELASNHDLRRRLGEAAKDHVFSEFTWEKEVEQLSKIYDQVLS